MKTYVLTVSRYFPTTHKRKGEPTYFVEKILACMAESTKGDFKIPNGIDYNWYEYYGAILKLHTIRASYDLWAKRIKEVQEGKAILSIRYWSGRPYHKDENGISQVEVCKLDKDSGIGVQKIEFPRPDFHFPIIDGWQGKPCVTPEVIAKNDGLPLDDFKEWFRKSDFSKPMAIIHFTSFRY